MELNELLSKYKEVENKTISVIKKKEFVEAVEPMLGKENTLKLYALRRGILISELADTIKEFPRLHKKQTLRLFENVACVRKEDSISGGRIMRETLIDLVETLETYTGSKITQDCDAPLRYLEDFCDEGEEVTIEDIADYFSERQDRKISKIIARSNPSFIETWKKKQEQQNSRKRIKEYLAESCGVKLEEIRETDKVIILHPCERSVGKDDYYIIIYWMEQAFDTMLPKNFDFNQRTIGDLIDFFAKR